MFLPPLGPGTRLRIDPPGTRGVCLIESIRFDPGWSSPRRPGRSRRCPRDGRKGSRSSMTIWSSLSCGSSPTELGGFAVTVDGQLFATGHNRPMIGYIAPGRPSRPLDRRRRGRPASRARSRRTGPSSPSRPRSPTPTAATGGFRRRSRRASAGTIQITRHLLGRRSPRRRLPPASARPSRARLVRHAQGAGALRRASSTWRTSPAARRPT